MTTRVFGALTMLACGCGLVSGLDSLKVDGGAVEDDAAAMDATDSNEASEDAARESATINDATSDADAQSPGFALMAGGSCTTANGSIALASGAFSVAFWMRSTGVLVSDEAIVWNGGRSSSEPGWSIDLQIGGLVFCASNATANSAKCTPAYPLPASHLIHLVATSTTNVQTLRTLNLYARDATNNDTAHVLVGQATGAPTTWTTTSTFTVGGALEGNSCASTLDGVIDGLRIASFAATIADMDASLLMNVCNSPNILDDFEFDEGTGTTTTSCAPGATKLTLGTNASFVTSPFP